MERVSDLCFILMQGYAHKFCIDFSTRVVKASIVRLDSEALLNQGYYI